MAEWNEFGDTYEEEGLASALSESPVGMLLDPGQIGSKVNVNAPNISEQLDPEMQARMQGAVGAMRSLRGRPTAAGMAAKRMGEQGLAEQYSRMSGASGARQHALSRKGAGMSGQILAGQGRGMSSEALQRYQLGTRMTQARMALQNGQVLFSLTERIKNQYAKNGIQLNQDQANAMALSAIASQIAGMQGEGNTTGTAPPHMDAVLPNRQPGLPPDQAYG